MGSETDRLQHDLKMADASMSATLRADLAQMAYLLAEIFGAPTEIRSCHFNYLRKYASTFSDLPANCLEKSPEELEDSWRENISILQGKENSLSLDESVYKVWTMQDNHPLRGATGHCFGDPAAHMLAALESFGLSVNAAHGLSPDSLSTLLEFLGFLVENRPAGEVINFCHDHLDWLDELERNTCNLKAGRILTCVIRITNNFVHDTVDKMEKINE